jgi:prepilin-type N-terminal cleavage/methylation domain-containing protein
MSFAREPKTGGNRCSAAETRAINARLPVRHPHAFTMIELLVVISIIALLMAVLLPTLGRVRKQAKAVACQAKLRQWGLVFSAYLTDADLYNAFAGIAKTGDWYRMLRPYCSDSNDMLLCPMATCYEVNKNWPFEVPPWGDAWAIRGTYRAWRRSFRSVEGHAVGGFFLGSYGINLALVTLYAHPLFGGSRGEATRKTPVLLDCASDSCWPKPEKEDPPPYDGALGERPCGMPSVCIDRHRGTIKGLFWDTTVRRIGLKELWALKWYPGCDTANAWTRAGGVQPEDWPAWMRGFKDY